MSKRMTLAEMKVLAVSATKTSSTWAYKTHYVGGDIVISVREPTDHTLRLTSLHSWNYAKAASCSTAVARAHLTKLAEAGLIVERKGWSGVRDFALLPEESRALGAEIIAELRAEGLPFEDEWRAGKAVAA